MAPGRLVLGSGVAGSTPGITGSGVNSSASNASTISTTNGLFIANNAAATISGIELINTTITDGTGTTLSLGLARDGGASPPNYAGAGNVTGVVTLNGGFTLTSDVQFNSALTLNGAVAIGNNDVVFNDALLTLKGQTVTGDNGEFQFIAAGSVFDPQVATVPGVNIIANTSLISRVTAIKTVRLAAIFNADTASDVSVGDSSPGDDFLTLADAGTIILANGGDAPSDNIPAGDKEVVLANTFNFTNEQTGVFSPFAVALYRSPKLITFTSDPGVANVQSLPEVGVGGQAQLTFMSQNFAQNSGRFNLAGHNVEVMGNVTFMGTAPIVNLQDNTAAGEIDTTPSLVSRTDPANPYSEFRLTGGDNGTMTITGLGGAPGAYVGAGVDLVLNKATETATVTLAGDGALLFDDQFTPVGVPAAFVGDTSNDETFVLKQGIFAMPVEAPADRAKYYVNLDHENSVTARTNEASTDDGQGFVFRAPSTPNVPVAQIAGTVQKRIVSNPNTSGTGSTPGRVVNPLGDRQGEYAEFVFDFESITRDQDFGRRDLRTTFIKMAPGGSLGLPIQDGVSPGVAVGSTGNFQWLVTSNPTLGANTEFNVEARYDGYTLTGGQSVADLRLVRRQFGDETMNPFTLVSTSYDNFLIDPSTTVAGDEQPTVVAQNAQALLGPQGTLFSYGLRAVTPTDVASFQVVNNAPSGGPIDVYVGNTLIANNLPFGEATAYQTVTGVGTSPTNLTVTVSPETSTSPSATGSRNFTATASQGATYAVVVFNDGMDATAGDPYDAVILNTQRTTSATSDTVELLAVNGSKDAGRIDIGLKGATTPFFRDLQFGEAGIAFQTGLDATLFRFDVSQQGTGTPFYTGNLDLTPARGERGLLIAQGLRTTPVGQPTRGFRLIFVRPDGSIILPTNGNTVGTDDATDIPAEFALRGTAPNPFRTTTSVRFDLPEAAEVQVEVYDALGRRVMQTAPSTMAPGANQGIEVNGTGFAAGLYVYRLTARGESQSWSQTGQITVLR